MRMHRPSTLQEIVAHPKKMKQRFVDNQVNNMRKKGEKGDYNRMRRLMDENGEPVGEEEDDDDNDLSDSDGLSRPAKRRRSTPARRGGRASSRGGRGSRTAVSTHLRPRQRQVGGNHADALLELNRQGPRHPFQEEEFEYGDVSGFGEAGASMNEVDDPEELFRQHNSDDILGAPLDPLLAGEAPPANGHTELPAGQSFTEQLLDVGEDWTTENNDSFGPHHQNPFNDDDLYLVPQQYTDPADHPLSGPGFLFTGDATSDPPEREPWFVGDDEHQYI